MDKRGPQVFSIAAGAPFLEILADQVLARFPTGEAPRPLSDWTILLPSRRAAQAFSEILLARSKKNALILPRIKPIGDLDEDRLRDEMVGGDLPQAMPAIATMLELTRLAKSWATAHPEIALAKAISASPVQALNLAHSLNEIVITSETHGLSVTDFTKLYDLDIAEHRQTITSLLELVLKDLPALQAAEGKMGATARRSAMIRVEARRIAEGGHSGPIIAAGSTGSIPATRELLTAIANHPEGAVILPGLDFIADEESWAAIKPEHPQFALKALLAEFQIERKDVEALGSKVSSRNLLASELFRPTETAPRWHNSLPLLREELATAVTGVTEIAAPDRHLEARVIALIMRETLERPNKTAALVTPDRDLAQRLVAELKRWNIQVFDSAGEPLSRRGLGAALDLLLQIPLDDIAPAKLFAFLRHPLVSFGLDPSTYPRLVQLFELTVLRGPMVMLESYEAMLLHAQAKAVVDHHLHPAVKGVTPGDWAALRTLAKTIDQLLGLLVHNGIGLAIHLNAYEQALHFAIAEQAWAETSSGLLDLLDELKTESQRWPAASADETAILLRQLLQSQTQPPTDDGHPRLAILGTIEARLLPYDVMILGGLNESVWPKGADPGPWLNRNMRQELNLPMPERDIGMAAHDFEQGFCASEVYLTWSKRINHAPFAPSRWLLRMKAVLGASGVAAPEAGNCLALAQHLHASETSRQIQMPNFAPPISARPVKFSVTEVETLIRNPYAIYAKKILKLEPVADFAERPDAGLRGSLFHEAIGKWNEKQAPDLEALRLEGEIVLASLGSAEERYFWRKHFGRLSEFLWAEQAQLREELVKIFAEQRGETTFKVAGIEHILSARADRIDILNNHTARIIDYKTGEIPSTDQVKANFSPQLTLQAAMLLDGAFSFKPKAVAELIYFQIGGGQNGLKKKIAVEGGAIVIAELAQKHWAGFINLLASYQNPNQPYLPRLSVKEEEKPQDYDHLSRYLEWQLAEQES